MLGIHRFFISFQLGFLAEILKSLYHLGIKGAYTNIVRNIYSASTSVISLHQESEKIKVGKGELISPIMF